MTGEDKAFFCRLARLVVVGVSNMVGAAAPEHSSMVGHWSIETVRMIDQLEHREGTKAA